jgi:hypothetical protein
MASPPLQQQQQHGSQFIRTANNITSLPIPALPQAQTTTAVPTITIVQPQTNPNINNTSNNTAFPPIPTYSHDIRGLISSTPPLPLLPRMVKSQNSRSCDRLAKGVKVNE